MEIGENILKSVDFSFYFHYTICNSTVFHSLNKLFNTQFVEIFRRQLFPPSITPGNPDILSVKRISADGMWNAMDIPHSRHKEKSAYD